MKAEEPAAIPYETNPLHALQAKAAEMVYKTTDQRVLMTCMEDLYMQDMPGVFTDDEYRKEIALAEKSGYVSNDEVQKELARWGFVR